MVKSGKAALAATVPLRKLRRVICMQALDFVLSFAIQGTAPRASHLTRLANSIEIGKCDLR